MKTSDRFRLKRAALIALLAVLATPAAFAQTTAWVGRDATEIQDCTSATVGQSVSCGLVRIRAIGGTVTLANPPYITRLATTEFTLSAAASNNCFAGQVLAVGSFCYVGQLFARPTSVGGKYMEIASRATVSTANSFAGFSTTGYTYSWQSSSFGTCTGGSGTWSYGAWSPTSGCGTITQTRTASCNANAGTGSQTRSVWCQRNDGTTVAGTFCSGSAPSSSQSCTPTSGFSCGTQGPTSQSVLLTNTCSYNWVTGAWGASSNTCSASATQTRSVSCLRSDGTTVADTSCNAGTRPASTQTVSDFSGCSYNWQSGSWSGCTGGAGTWSYSTWSPASGCGTTTQTRTASCDANAGSATQTRSVTCLRSDGTTVADASCAGAKPAVSQSCTPTSGFSCGSQGALSQSTLLTDTCTYSWDTGSWNACIGGTGTWSYSPWTPTSGCGDVTQTRSASCNADVGSASQTRNVNCMRSDGAAVADAFCSTTKPAGAQSCTPLSGFSCGSAASTNRLTLLTDTCTYDWSASGFGACQGGSGTWISGPWLPATGCGPTAQNRTLACNVDANSGTRTQSVVCLRSDGQSMADSSCNPLTRPVSSQSCTPGSVDCGAAPSSNQSSLLTSACPAANGAQYRGCTPDPANHKYCIFSPL